MGKLSVFFLLAGVLFFLYSGAVNAQGNIYQDAYTAMVNTENIQAGTVLDIMETIAGWLLFAGAIIAGIVIILSGIIYMFAGSNTGRVATARSVFKNGIIGALIVFAAGLIVNTIVLLASNWSEFFAV